MRLGARSVTIIALEDKDRLPAYRNNVESARADGIDFICSHGIEKIVCKEGKVTALDLMKCVGVFDEKGAFAPTFDRGVSREVAADKVILAIGQETDCSSLPQEIVGADGRIMADPHTHQTPMSKVFAAGDAVSGPTSVAQAVFGGKRAAQAITLFLRGIELESLPPREMLVTQGLPKNALLPKVMRHEKTAKDKKDCECLSEPYRGFELIEALAEADRCLICGAKSVALHLEDCMTCFSCELNCPTGAIFVHPFKESMPRSLPGAKP
jgi:NAD-dependent dihydropyrimidine dehydrogenase PreA subunit